MPNYNEFLNLIKSAAKEQRESDAPATVCHGVVTSASPLSVQIDQRFIVSAANLIVPQHLSSYTVSATIDGSTADAEGHNHKLGSYSLRIDNSLKTGDRLILVRQDGGQMYLIVDRVV